MNELDFTEQDLNSLFDELNEDLFDGELPHYKVKLINRGNSKFDKEKKTIYVNGISDSEDVCDKLFLLMLDLKISFEEN